MSSRLQGRVGRLERATGSGTCGLLYPTSWPQQKLDAKIAELKQTYANVFLLELDDEDMEECVEHGIVSNWTHEEALKQLR